MQSRGPPVQILPEEAGPARRFTVANTVQAERPGLRVSG